VFRGTSITLLAAAVLGGAGTVPAGAQTVANAIFDRALVQNLTTHAVAPGREMMATLREVFGAPVVETFWQNYRLLYPAEGDDAEAVEQLPRSAFDSKPVASEARSAPHGLETESKVRAIFGAPEHELRVAAYTLLEYTELGLRFLFSPLGEYNGAFVIQQDLPDAWRTASGDPRQANAPAPVRGGERNSDADSRSEQGGTNAATAAGDYRIRDNALRMIKDSCARK
jgi:hypothetical protein